MSATPDLVNEYLTKLLNGVLVGMRAFTTQGYEEANSKNGTQWEASRKVTAADGQVFLSIIKTGAKHVDLKKRVFGYSGEGLTARIYKDPVYTGGTPDPVYNLNTGVANDTQLFQLLVGFTLTSNGTECGAPIFAVGPVSNQGQGTTPREFGANRILLPNTSYLLYFMSDSAQDIAAYISMYEGDLDLPEAE